MSYINPLLGGNLSLGGVQMALAAAYESRIHTFSKMSVPRAQFAGDTAVTLTDGSYNSRHTINIGPAPVFLTTVSNPGPDIPTSATAQLASTSNSNAGKPMVIRTLRDPFNAEIYDYAVFNADGTFPGGVNPLNYNSVTQRWEINPLARYLVNKETGEIYVNRKVGIQEHQNPDGLVDMDGGGTRTLLDTAHPSAQGLDNVVGIVDFEGLQGGALSAAQQEASELSGVIQSLTSVLRTFNDSKKSVLGLIR